MKQSDLDEILKRPGYSIDSETVARPLRAAIAEPNQREALGGVPVRKETGSKSVACRYRITFTIYAVRPLDWDNAWTKGLQDLLVAIGFLPDDNWQVLEGCVVSKKAKRKILERTVIEIERLQ